MHNPVTFLHKSSKQLKANEAEQMWPDDIYHSSDTLISTHSMQTSQNLQKIHI